MVWPAIIGAVGSIAGGLIGSSGQRSANRTNIMLQREQQAWQERMANTEIQRRKADMLAAGFNPLLSVMSGQGASTPSVAPAQVQNEKAALGEGVSRAAHSAAQVASMRLIESQAAMQEAQARKTTAEAAITEAGVPFSGESARLQRDKLENEVFNLRAQFDAIAEGTAKTMTEAEIMRQAAPLMQEYQRLLNRGEQLGLAEKKALADLYQSLKGAKGFERLGALILSILREARR